MIHSKALSINARSLYALGKDVVEKLLPIVRKKYPQLSDDEILATAERFFDLATFLVKLHVKKRWEKPELGNSQEENI
jgi:hypothetical protein